MCSIGTDRINCLKELTFLLPSAIYIVLNDPFALGGVQRVVSVLARGFQDAGHQVSIVGVRSRAAEIGFDEAVDVSYVFPFPRLRLPLSLETRIFKSGMKFERLRIFSRRAFIQRFEKLVRDSPGHVIAMDVFAAELIAKIKMPAGFARVVQFHNSFDAIDGTRDLDRLKRISSKLDILLALSDVDADGFRRVVACETEYLPNPLPFPSTPVLGYRPNRVVCIGRLVPHKGNALVVEAWASLRPELREEWKLILIGDGPEASAIQRQVTANGLEDSVTLAGPRQDIQWELRSARVLVLASTYEGLPMVLIEAMSQSVACIATDSSAGVHQLLESGAGMLVAVGDKRQLANALRDLLSNPTKISATARAGFLKTTKYELSTIIPQWESVLQRYQGAVQCEKE